MNYVPLYVKTDNSLLSSLIKINELIDFAKKNNLKALTITDDNLFGAIEFYEECTKNNIKPIIGLEITLENKFVLYAENYEGFKNLMKIFLLISEKNLDEEMLKKYSDGLLCVLCYESIDYKEKINNIYKHVFYGYKNDEEKKLLNEENCVFFNETVCLIKDDEKYLKYLKAIKEGKNINEIEVNYYNPYILFKEEDSNKKILELCNLKIKKEKSLFPLYCDEPEKMLKSLCIEGMKKKFGSTISKKYQERLKYELKIINEMGFANYFLVVYDYVKYAKENNILVGPGRGSSAGSLVAYILNITEIDPIKYNLLFERFLNPERVTMPDIDIDFEDEKRKDVLEYIKNKYGEEKVAGIMTFSTLSAKQVIRDVGKVMNISINQIDYLSKLINPNKSFKANFEDEKIKEFLKTNNLLNLYFVAYRLNGLKRHVSIHACGIVISKDKIVENIPLYKDGDVYLTLCSSKYLEEYGFLKMDLLALKNLSLIKEILNEIKTLKFEDINIDDKNVLKLFSEGKTEGIFQFNSSGMKDFLKKLKPTSIEDLFSAIALYRPGPMENIDTYIKRKNGKAKISYLHKDLEEILKSTYGIIVYQEQIMQIAVKMAGYKMSEADILRSAMSKKKEDILLKEKEKFINGFIKNGYTKELALNVYNLILKFASYGFNRSHSVVYAVTSYKMAYLKYYFPKEFMKVFLSSVKSSPDKTKEYIMECKLNNIKVLKPDINESNFDYTILKSGIRCPLNIIKNISSSLSLAIIEERKKGLFKDIFDFVSRCKNVDGNVLKNLIYAGAFEKMEYNKKTLIDNIDVIINYSEISSYLDEDVLKPELNLEREYPSNILMEKEYEVLGFYFSKHPTEEYKIKYKNVTPIKDLEFHFDKIVEVVGYLEKIKEINTKDNKEMAFLVISDEMGKIDVTVFPRIYENLNSLKKGDILFVIGRVEKRFDKHQIVASKIEKLNVTSSDN